VYEYSFKLCVLKSEKLMAGVRCCDENLAALALEYICKRM
jgi:hypothetical protein